MNAPERVDPDRSLVLACQASPAEGFQGAFRELYEQYKDRVYNVCFRITGNATDALDASQETFGILHRKLSDFRFESKFSSWVYRIAVNASIDIKRRGSARALASLESLDSDDSDVAGLDPVDERSEAPNQAASRHELEADIQLAIDRLSPKMRAITVLRYIEGLSYEEIGEALGISLGTVKSRLSRAHAALDRELTPVLDRHYLAPEYPTAFGTASAPGVPGQRNRRGAGGAGGSDSGSRDSGSRDPDKWGPGTGPAG